MGESGQRSVEQRGGHNERAEGGADAASAGLASAKWVLSNQRPPSAPAAEIVRALRALAEENESWEWPAPVGPGNASYANGYENGRRAVGADIRALLDAYPPASCCCEMSPPEFGGNLPDRECPIHGEEANRG